METDKNPPVDLLFSHLEASKRFDKMETKDGKIPIQTDKEDLQMKKRFCKKLAASLLALVMVLGINAFAAEYTVESGDSLSSIAQEQLGDSSRWKEIYEANKDTIEDPNLIYVGQTLIIPDGETEEKNEDEPQVTTPGKLTDGTYTGTGKGRNGNVTVSVTFAGGVITAVQVTDHSETAGICESAIERIPEAIVENQSVAVDTVSGATLTSQGILDAVKDSITKAGGNVDDFMKTVEKENSGKVEQYTADVVVVGGGGSGMSAALAAHQTGAKVIVLEKTANLGGSSVMSMGMGAWNSKFQQEDPETTFTAGEWMKDWLDQQNYLVSGPMIYKFITESGPTVDWLVENGVELTFAAHSQEALMDDPIRTYHHWAGEGGLAGALNRVAATIESEGSLVMKETKGTEILMENGAVAGVKGEKADGTTVEVKAKAVIIATGGYGANSEKMEEVLGFKTNGINSGAQMGEGIDMAVAVGAATDGLENVEFHGIACPTDLMAQVEGDTSYYMMLAQNPSLLWVNMDGNRFTNEDICFDTAYCGNVAAAQGDHYYSIMNQTILDTLENQGEGALGRTTASTGFRPLALDQGWTGLTEQLERGYASGVIVKADTLEELAQKLDVPYKQLKETVEAYNASCAAGEDAMYGKPKQYLTAMEGGPYYAVMGRASELCTLGGLKITTNMEVVSTDNQVIPGLYSAGVDCSGSMFNTAYVSYEGVTMGWTMTSGRLAGEAAGAYVK